MKISAESAKKSLFKNLEDMSQEDFDNLSPQEKAFLLPYIEEIEMEQEMARAEQEAREEEARIAREEQEKEQRKQERKDKRQQFVMKGIKKGKEYLAYVPNQGTRALNFLKRNLTKQNLKNLMRSAGREVLNGLKAAGRYIADSRVGRAVSEFAHDVAHEVKEMKDDIVKDVKETKDTIVQGVKDIRNDINERIGDAKADYNYAIEQAQLKSELRDFKDSKGKNRGPNFSYISDNEEKEVQAYLVSGKGEPEKYIIACRTGDKEALYKLEGNLKPMLNLTTQAKMGSFLHDKVSGMLEQGRSAGKIEKVALDARSNNVNANIGEQKLDTPDVGKGKKVIETGRSVINMFRSRDSKEEVAEH